MPAGAPGVAAETAVAEAGERAGRGRAIAAVSTTAMLKTNRRGEVVTASLTSQRGAMLARSRGGVNEDGTSSGRQVENSVSDVRCPSQRSTGDQSCPSFR